jgi:hypothetical protein
MGWSGYLPRREKSNFLSSSLAIALEQAGRWTDAASAYETALAKTKDLPEDKRAAIRPRLEARLAGVRQKVRGAAG